MILINQGEEIGTQVFIISLLLFLFPRLHRNLEEKQVSDYMFQMINLFSLMVFSIMRLVNRMFPLSVVSNSLVVILGVMGLSCGLLWWHLREKTRI